MGCALLHFFLIKLPYKKKTGVAGNHETAVFESDSRTDNLSPARGLLRASGDAMVLGLVAAISDSQTGTISPASGLLRCSGDVVVLGPTAEPDVAVSASPIGKFAVRDPSPSWVSTPSRF
jgi:hypothetical protein